MQNLVTAGSAAQQSYSAHTFPKGLLVISHCQRGLFRGGWHFSQQKVSGDDTDSR